MRWWWRRDALNNNGDQKKGQGLQGLSRAPIVEWQGKEWGEKGERRKKKGGGWEGRPRLSHLFKNGPRFPAAAASLWKAASLWFGFCIFCASSVLRISVKNFFFSCLYWLCKNISAVFSFIVKHHLSTGSVRFFLILWKDWFRCYFHY